MRRHYIALTDRSGINLNPAVDCSFSTHLLVKHHNPKEFFMCREPNLLVSSLWSGFRISAMIVHRHERGSIRWRRKTLIFIHLTAGDQKVEEQAVQ